MHGLFWSTDSLQDNAVLRACPGDNVTFDWRVRTGYASDEIVDMQWFFEGRSHEMMALLDQGQFEVLPAFSGRLQRMTNAGVVLIHVSESDSGNYSVVVVGGDANSQPLSTLQRTVALEIAGKTQSKTG